LLYVAMTRARETLQLVVPQRFYVHQQSGLGDRHVYGTRTRFLPDGLLPLFERLPRPREAAPGQEAQAVPAPVAKVDIAGRMRSLWK
jgi:DNA helicase-2/ATP-dependent DNA helicase PcrA